jgi:hypothetical protein
LFFWVLPLCGLVGRYQRFEETHCITHRHGFNPVMVSFGRNEIKANNEERGGHM